MHVKGEREIGDTHTGLMSSYGCVRDTQSVRTQIESERARVEIESRGRGAVASRSAAAKVVVVVACKCCCNNINRYTAPSNHDGRG